MVGIMAICFAPGATTSADDGHPRALAAAVLAPTVMDHGGSPAVPRDSGDALPRVAVVIGLVLALEQATRFAPVLVERAHRVTLPPRRRPPRRGPPPLAG